MTVDSSKPVVSPDYTGGSPASNTAEPLPADVIDAILQIPETLAAFYSRGYPNVRQAPWFPEHARNAQMAVMGQSAAFAGAEDVDDALWSYLIAALNLVIVGRAVLPLTQEKWRGQKWTVDGVYDRSVLGSREVEFGGLLFRALGGECRYRIVNGFLTHLDASQMAREVVFHGVYDPLEPQRHYWTLAVIEALPSILVTDLASVVLGLSDLGGTAPEVRRSLSDGNREIDFLLGVLRKRFSVMEEEAETKRSVARNWLFENQGYWRGFAPESSKGDSLFGAIGKSIGRALAEDGNQREIPISDAHLEYRLHQIDAATRGRAEFTTANTSLPPETGADDEEAKRAVVDWLSAAEGRNNFAERVQVKFDVESAFRAVYGVDPGPLTGIALRDFRVFMSRFIMDFTWGETGAFLGLPATIIAAANKNLQRRTEEIKAWLRESYRDNRRRTPISTLQWCLNRWERDDAHQRATVLLEDGTPVTGEHLLKRAIYRCGKADTEQPEVRHRRPAALDGCRLPAIEISHDWERGTNDQFDFGTAGGTRIAL